MKMTINRLSIIFFMLTSSLAYANDVQDVSLIQLIANPDQFNGKDVRVIGFLHLEFEGDAVYSHRDDYEYSIHKNSVSINLSESQIGSWRKLSGGYVIVQGRFNSVDQGHFGARSGSLQNITRLGNWSVRRSQIKGSKQSGGISIDKRARTEQ
ncbi:hypothetical protein D3C81_687150 [compost metagenome]